MLNIRTIRSNLMSTNGPRIDLGIWRWTVLILLLTLGSVGCGGTKQPKMAPVQGRVFYQDQPVAHADVTFVCSGAPRFSAGKTDEQGNYTLTTYEPGDGAVVGHNRVSVSLSTMPDEQSLPDTPLTDEYFDIMKESRRKAAKKVLPTRFADPATSELTAEVTDGVNKIDLHLSDKTTGD